MGDWTSQNWTKRDGRNNQEQQQEQQEKKATYKTAAELAVKNMIRKIRTFRSYNTKLDFPGKYVLYELKYHVEVLYNFE